MTKNHHRADHTVNELPHLGGFNVRLYYKGYEVSLACDGTSTCVYTDVESSDELFETDRTTGEAVLLAFQFIDTLQPKD